MIRIALEKDIADQIRCSVGQIELVDNQGQRTDFVRRSPTEVEVVFAKSRIRTKGQKFSVDELIAKV